MSEASVIEIDHLTKYYGRREIVRDLSLTVTRGTIYGFLGRNGMGKTTTIRVFLGLEDRPAAPPACWARTRGSCGRKPVPALATCPRAIMSTAG